MLDFNPDFAFITAVYLSSDLLEKIYTSFKEDPLKSIDFRYNCEILTIYYAGVTALDTNGKHIISTKNHTVFVERGGIAYTLQDFLSSKELSEQMRFLFHLNNYIQEEQTKAKNLREDS